MVKRIKRFAAVALAGVLTMGLLASCGGSGSGAASSGSGESSGDGTAITIFNSKMEIQSQLEEMAAE